MDIIDINIVQMLTLFYIVGGFVTLAFYLDDMSDVKFGVDKFIVSMIALFLFPAFWLMRRLISEGFK